MTIQELKQHLENIYGFDLAVRSRKRELVDARRIFCKLGFGLQYNLREIGEQIDRKHCNVIHLLDTADLVTNIHKKIHDNMVDEYGILSKKYYVDKLQEMKKQLIVERDEQTLNLIEEVNNTITKWDTNTINKFIETRLKPYNKLINATKPQKKIQKTPGAKLNRPVKNPVLC